MTLAFDEMLHVVKIINTHGDVVAVISPDDLFDFDGNRFDFED